MLNQSYPILETFIVVTSLNRNMGYGAYDKADARWCAEQNGHRVIRVMTEDEYHENIRDAYFMGYADGHDEGKREGEQKGQLEARMYGGTLYVWKRNDS